MHAPAPARIGLANWLTFGRLAAVPALVAVMLALSGPARDWTALAIFSAASITDYLDGYIARAWQQQSALGRMLDPIADKLLVGAALIMLVAQGTIAGPHLVAAIIILCREILVSGLREYLAELRVAVAVSWLAKWKTAVQLVALGFLLSGAAGDAAIGFANGLGLCLLWAAALLTLYTGYDYVRAGLKHVV